MKFKTARNNYDCPDCDEGTACQTWMGGGAPRRAAHATCVGCFRVTSNFSIFVDPKTLRRRKMYWCRVGEGTPGHEQFLDEQDKLREKRAENDWGQLSEPVDTSGLDLGRMVEQYGGPTRQAIRAFMASDEAVATVLAVPMSTVNQSIQVLGLSERLYAEQRGSETVIRKVAS